MWEIGQWIWGAACLCCTASAALPPLIAAASLALWLTRVKPASMIRLSKYVAHRGAMLDAPQNTLPAFEYCVHRGCDVVEFDLRTTKDGKCILWHDPTLSGKPIADTEWNELKDTDVAKDHPLSERFGIVNLCLFEDAISYLSENHIKAIIDVKTTDRTIYTSVVEAFKKRPELYDTTIVTSFNPVIIHNIRSIDPSIVGGLNYRPNIFSAISNDAIGRQFKRYPNNILYHCLARLCDEIYGIVWAARILPYWVGSSLIILHKDMASLHIIEGWRKRGYSIATWGVNQPIEKIYTEKILGIPYITDTLIAEPTVHREMNGKIN